MDNLDLLTDEELDALLSTVQARKSRIRVLVKMGRIDRQEYDALVAQEDAVRGEIARRGGLLVAG